MVHIEAEWCPEHVGLPGDRIVPAGFAAYDPEDLDQNLSGAEVRFRWLVEPEHRQAARAAAERWRCEAFGAGAITVKLEEVVMAETRARAPEVAAAPTLREKLRALWASRGEQASDRLLSMVGELEAVQ
jgi:hypothetical protein